MDLNKAIENSDNMVKFSMQEESNIAKQIQFTVKKGKKYNFSFGSVFVSELISQENGKQTQKTIAISTAKTFSKLATQRNKIRRKIREEHKKQQEYTPASQNCFTFFLIRQPNSEIDLKDVFTTIYK